MSTRTCISLIAIILLTAVAPLRAADQIAQILSRAGEMAPEGAYDGAPAFITSTEFAKQGMISEPERKALATLIMREKFRSFRHTGHTIALSMDAPSGKWASTDTPVRVRSRFRVLRAQSLEAIVEQVQADERIVSANVSKYVVPDGAGSFDHDMVATEYIAVVERKNPAESAQ